MTALNISKIVEQLEFVYIVDGNAKWYNHFWKKKSPIASYKMKHTPDLQTSNSTQERGKKYIHTKIFIIMFITAWVIVVPNWKPPRCPLIEDWLNKPWKICILEYCAAVKRNKLLVHTTWMNFKNIILSKTSLT